MHSIQSWREHPRSHPWRGRFRILATGVVLVQSSCRCDSHSAMMIAAMPYRHLMRTDLILGRISKKKLRLLEEADMILELRRTTKRVRFVFVAGNLITKMRRRYMWTKDSIVLFIVGWRIGAISSVASRVSPNCSLFSSHFCFVRLSRVGQTKTVIQNDR